MTVPNLVSCSTGISATGTIERHEARDYTARFPQAGTTGTFSLRRLRNSCRSICRCNILGAHLVGPHADEVINLFGLAIRHHLTADDLKATMFAYPTGASDIGYML
jgi:glutathione reductase (NADPH)